MSNPFRIVSHRRLPPFPGNIHHGSGHCIGSGRPFSPGDSMTMQMDGVSGQSGDMEDFVKSFLSSHREILDDYIMEYVTTDELELWMKKKKENNNVLASLNGVPSANKPFLQKRYLSPKLVNTEHQLLKDIFEKKDVVPMLYELANVIATAVGADTFSMYIPRAGGNELCLCIPPEPPDGVFRLKTFGPVGEGTTVAAYVGKMRKGIAACDLVGDDRFPRGIGCESSLTSSVICTPVILPSDDMLCIMEFVRSMDKAPFNDAALQTVNALVVWVALSLYQSQVNKTLLTQADLNDFLLDVSKIIFDDIVAMDRLVEKIMMFTKDLVNADRCSLFLVDQEKRELYANFFDEGKYKDGKPMFKQREEVRFPMDRGIAGLVATTSDIVNIPDAYGDPRFNRDIDKQTGYTTKSILCMPIISKGKVIGVVQMLNKKDGGCFSQADASSFRMFAVYCALALHYSKMYSNVVKQTSLYKVALEQLKYHAAASDEEVAEAMKRPVLIDSKVPEDFNSIYFVAEPKYEALLPQLFIKMLHNLFGPNVFDIEKLVKFTLTVKKNYRPVPYHNWLHGWSVAHSMYCLLQRINAREVIEPLRMQAMMIACLCHDVDHRGYNNAFLQKFNEPLAVLYQTSTMEMHHYNHTVNILQGDGHNIFSQLNTEDYRKVLHYMRIAIMSTDLAQYLQKQGELSKIILTSNFNLDNPEHKEDVLALLMTASDLMVVCKCWPEQKAHTEALYEEFYEQGDYEKSLGGQPLPMMDRSMQECLPKHQVGFLKFVCVPLYTTLCAIFPDLQDIVRSVRANLEQWERVVEGRSTSVWEPGKSRPAQKEKE